MLLPAARRLVTWVGALGRDIDCGMENVSALARASARPLTVVYVAGIGRTGSTVLGELLDRFPDVVFVGELSLFWRRYAQRELCGCGEPLPECGFWSAVVRRGFGQLPPGRAEDLARLERRARRRQARQMLVSTRWATRSRAPAVQELLAERGRLYRAVSEVAGSSCVVDTGKDPVYGASLEGLDSATVVIVHLVRDPRGVAYSSSKRVRSDSEPGELDRLPAVVTAWQYLTKNLFAHLALRRLAHRYVRVRYEDLVADPEASLRQIADAAGLPVADLHAAVERLALLPQDHHLVAGNPGVRRRGGALRLVLDEEWRVELPARDRRLVASICAAPMMIYGYSLRVRPGSRRSAIPRQLDGADLREQEPVRAVDGWCEDAGAEVARPGRGRVRRSRLAQRLRAQGSTTER
jgi:Sulfotransferase family